MRTRGLEVERRREAIREGSSSLARCCGVDGGSPGQRLLVDNFFRFAAVVSLVRLTSARNSVKLGKRFRDEDGGVVRRFG